MAALVFCLASSEFYKKDSFSSKDIFLSPDENSPNNQTTFRIPSGSPSIHEIYSIYPQLPKCPDFVFIKTDALGRNFVRDLSSLGCPVIASLADTHHLHRPLEKLINYAASQNFSLISIENDRHHSRWYSRFGINNLCWLPNLALEPFMFNPLPAKDRIQKMCFVGSVGQFHPYRRHILSKISERFSDAVDCFSLSREEASKKYNNYLISINVSLNSDLNWRFFEIIAAGGFLLTDRLPLSSGINGLLQEGIHYEAFSSLDELHQKASYYLKNPCETQKIARAGFETYWQNLSPKVLRKEMLSRIYSFPTSDVFSLPNDLPETINIEYPVLLRIYQVCQEIHRISVNPLVIVCDNFKQIIERELQDFPRFTCLTPQEFASKASFNFDSVVIIDDTNSQIEKFSTSFSNIVFIPLDYFSNERYGNEQCFLFASWNLVFRYNKLIDAYTVS